jgi:hypothetical protein
MRPTTIAIAAALAVSAAGIGAALRGPSGDQPSSEPAPAARVAGAAGAAAAAPPQVPASPAGPDHTAPPGDVIAFPEGSTLQRELSEPERREAQAYPWEELEAVLGRTITAEERDRMRDLRKEHGLRLAEARGRMQRGELPRAEFDAWRAARSSEFREEVQDALGCSPEQVTALLATPLRQPGP